MSLELDPEIYEQRLEHALQYQESGKITKSLGLVYEAYLPGAAVGSIVEVLPTGRERSATDGQKAIEAEVIGFRDKRVILMPFGDSYGVNNDSRVILKRKASTVRVGHSLLGRVLDGRGEPIDGKGPLAGRRETLIERGLYRSPTHPLQREMVSEPLDVGVRAINGLLTCGKGQRLGIMAGSGVGKSVLLGMMARNTAADVNVIALIGERGRELREFVEKDLGPEGLARSVVIVATSDQSALLRMRAAYLAMSVAEYFRDEGKDVLMLMDSVTRFCMAQREIGLSMGEPPAQKGYTPSVFSTLPKLLERAGMAPERGSITGFFSVLVEGDDLDDPIADCARSILDGHIVLSRRIAERNHFPAIDVLQSTSRVMRAVIAKDQFESAGRIREWIAAYAQAEDLINIGAYVKGSNPKIDQAVHVHDRIDAFLRQSVEEKSTYADSEAGVQAICRGADAFQTNASAPQTAKR